METEEEAARKRNRSEEQKEYLASTSFYSPEREPRTKQKKKSEHQGTRFAPIVTETPASSPERRQRLNSETQTTPITPEMSDVITKNVTVLYPMSWYTGDQPPDPKEIMDAALRIDDFDCYIQTNDYTEQPVIKDQLRRLRNRFKLLYEEITFKSATKRDFEVVQRAQSRSKPTPASSYAEQVRTTPQIPSQQSVKEKTKLWNK